LAILPDRVRRAQADHLAHRLAHLHFQVVALAHHPHIGAAHLTQQVQRRLRLLAQSEFQGVLLAPLPQGLLDVPGHPVESVGRTGAVDPLVRTLVVVVLHPVIEPLARIGE